MQFICNQLSIPMEFVIYLQSISNSDGMCNLFAISYQFLVKFVIHEEPIINSNWQYE